jgi:diacylglycerol O-acyltransferase / wax synthase
MTINEISPLDLAFLCLERQTAPMHIAAVAVFAAEDGVDPVRVRALLADRAQRTPRLRLRARASWWGLTWEEHPGFQADNHLFTHHLPDPGGREELAGLVSEVVTEPLELCRPLWAAHLITGLDGGRFAVVVKLHHALADGATAIEIGLGLLDGFAPAPHAPPEGAAQAGPGSPPWEALLGPQRMLQAVRAATRHAGEAVDIAAAMLRHARLPEPGSAMAAPASAAKRVALLPLGMPDLLRIRERHGGTTNDVLLAVVTGALRRWLSTRGHPVDDLSLRALVPVNHRPRARGQVGNQLSGYLCDLPVGEAEPAERLRAIRNAMDSNKAGGPHRGPGAFPVLASRFLPPVNRVLTPVLAGGASLLFDTVVTNVPLPGVPVSLAGARLCELYPLAPLAAGQAMSIAASRYRDTMHIGIHANRAALPDIEKLTEAVPYAVVELDDAAAR